MTQWDVFWDTVYIRPPKGRFAFWLSQTHKIQMQILYDSVAAAAVWHAVDYNVARTAIVVVVDQVMGSRCPTSVTASVADAECTLQAAVGIRPSLQIGLSRLRCALCFMIRLTLDAPMQCCRA